MKMTPYQLWKEFVVAEKFWNKEIPIEYLNFEKTYYEFAEEDWMEILSTPPGTERGFWYVDILPFRFLRDWLCNDDYLNINEGYDEALDEFLVKHKDEIDDIMKKS